MSLNEELPDFADIQDANVRIRPQALRTPLLESAALNERVGGRVLIKAEPLQRTGSFKFRGAYNRLLRLSDEERQRGVVAFSSGNHAQGVAAAAQLIGTPAVIVMPEDAPRIKMHGTIRYGAEVVTYERSDLAARERIAGEIAAERGLTTIRPFEDRYVMAGQGTVGLEMFEQARDQEFELDAVIGPAGGGGLMSGVATAIKHLSPETEIYTAEAEGFDTTARSLAAGQTVALEDTSVESFCDALLATKQSAITFEILRNLITEGLVVPDLETAQAMLAAYQHLKLIVEPGGAVALAAVLSGHYNAWGKTVGVICSGGNVDSEVFADVLGLDEQVEPEAREGIAAAIAVTDAFMDALNRRDVAAIRESFNYPHHRLGGRTGSITFGAAEDYNLDRFDAVTAPDGWHHSEFDYRQVVQADPEKVHLELQFTRYRADGSEIASYSSLWVVTCRDGHWGIQMRSSFAP